MKESDVNALVSQVAARALRPHKIARIESEPTSDSEGQDALHITVVLEGDDRGISGDLALDTIVDIRRGLQREGEDRTPIINFTNEAELESDVDLESGAPL